MPGVVVLEDYEQDGRQCTRRVAGGQSGCPQAPRMTDTLELGVVAPDDLPSFYKVETG